METVCLECVIDRISKYDANAQHEIKLFDVRIIFLITALNVSTRDIASGELNGDVQLITMLENVSNSNYVTPEKPMKVLV